MKVGASTLCLLDKSLGVALNNLVRYNLDFVEILNEGYHSLNEYNYHLHLEFLESYGLKNIIHAPFSDVNIASLNERLRRPMLQLIFNTLEIAQKMGSLLVVLHPGHFSPLSKRFLRTYEKVHKRSLEEIDRVAQKLDIKVGLENMPAFPILDGLTPERLYELIDGTDLYITFDVGHLNTVNSEFEEFIDLLGDRIIHVHLHDNDGKNDNHLPLGEGSIDWNALIRNLPKDITWGIEMESLRDLEKSLKYLQSLV